MRSLLFSVLKNDNVGYRQRMTAKITWEIFIEATIDFIQGNERIQWSRINKVVICFVYGKTGGSKPIQRLESVVSKIRCILELINIKAIIILAVVADAVV